MALFKALSGNRANLPEEKHDGYVYFCEDDGSFHVDYKDAAGALQRKQINAKDAETLCGMTLDEIKTYVTVQPDWAQTNSASADYIKNKPNVVTEEIFNEEINKRPIAYPAVINDGVMIDPGKKIDPELVDAEWMATETQSDLNITISNENADSFKVIAGMLTKISDYAPTIEQIKTGTFTTIFLDGTVQETPITDDMIYHDDETMSSDMYEVNEILMVLGSKVTIEGITLSEGIYLAKPVNDVLSGMNASSINIDIPDAITTPNLLPEKYLPEKINPELVDMDWYAGKTEPVTDDLTIEWDGVIGDKYIFHVQDPETGFQYAYVKVSNTVPTAEDLATCEVYGKLGDSEIPQTGSTIADEESLGVPCIFIGNEDSIPQIIIVQKPHTNEFLGEVQQSGIYFVSKTENFYVSKLYLPSYTQHVEVTLPGKYLPEESKPKILDLGSYKSSDGVSFEQAILGTVAFGGGSVNLTGDDVDKFWKDVATNKLIVTKINCSALDLPCDIYTPCIVVEKAGEGTVQISSYTTILNGTSFLKLMIAMYRSGEKSIAITTIAENIGSTT